METTGGSRLHRGGKFLRSVRRAASHRGAFRNCSIQAAGKTDGVNLGSLRILSRICFPQLKGAQIRVVIQIDSIHFSSPSIGMHVCDFLRFLFIADCWLLDWSWRSFFFFLETKPKPQPPAFFVSNKKFLLSGRKFLDEQFHFKNKYDETSGN